MNQQRAMKANQLLEEATRHAQGGNVAAAEALYEKGRDKYPELGHFSYLLGTLVHEAGNPDRARNLYAEALRRSPELLQAKSNLAVAYLDLKEPQTAIGLLRDLTDQQPNNLNVLNNLGNAYQMSHQFNDAISCYRRVLRESPESVDVWSNLGIAFQKTGRWAESEQAFRQALKRAPDHPEYLRSLALSLQQLRRTSEAVPLLQQAVRLSTDNAAIRHSLFNALYQTGEFEAAQAALKELIQDTPNACWQFQAGTLCPILPESIEQIEQARIRVQETLQTTAAGTLSLQGNQLFDYNLEPSFYLGYQGRNNRSLKEAYARFFAQALPTFDLPPAAGSGSECCRLGFPVTPGHELIFLTFMDNLLQGLDSTRFTATVITFSESVAKLQKRLPAGVELLTVPSDWEQVLNTILDAGFDLLYYFESGTDSINYFMPFYRLAPVQVMGCGYPETTGIANMDYVLSSQWVEPVDAPQVYSETLIAMRSNLTFMPRPPLPESSKTRTDFGLTPDQHVYGCLQSLYKLHPDMDTVFAEILRGDPDGVLLLLEGVETHWEEVLMRRFAQSMPDVIDRIRWMPRQSPEDFRAVMACCDVMLDTLHFGAGTTALESFAFGIPFVTCPGEFARGRYVSGFYRRMDCCDLIAEDVQSYVRLALRVGMDPAFRQEMTAKILSRSACLFEDGDFMAEQARFFETAIQAARQGERVSDWS